MVPDAPVRRSAASDTIDALLVDNTRLRAALRAALQLEQFWRLRALLGPPARRAPTQRDRP